MAEPMKVRIQLKGDTAEIRVVIAHPMETGQRKIPGTGEVVPAHFIQLLTATVNGRTVVSGQLGPAVSKNPFFAFRVKGARAGDKVKVIWQDNKGQSGSAEAVVP